MHQTESGDNVFVQTEDESKTESSVSPSSMSDNQNTSPLIFDYPSGKFRNDRRTRTTFTKEQILELEKEYAQDNYLSRIKRQELSAKLQLPESTVKVWFQNRRMKAKKEVSHSYWSYLPMYPPNPYLPPISSSSLYHTRYPPSLYPYDYLRWRPSLPTVPTQNFMYSRNPVPYGLDMNSNIVYPELPPSLPRSDQESIINMRS